MPSFFIVGSLKGLSSLRKLRRSPSLPRGLVLFIISTCTFFIGRPSDSLQACLNHSSRLFMINAKIFGLLYDFYSSPFLLLS